MRDISNELSSARLWLHFGKESECIGCLKVSEKMIKKLLALYDTGR